MTITNGMDSSFTNAGTALTLTVVPEPTATAFGLLAMGGLLLRRRRD